MTAAFRDQKIPIERLDVSAYTVPTESPESDGTYAWNKTTLVIVEATAGGLRSLGYTYADTSTAQLIKSVLAEVVIGCDALAIPAIWIKMAQAIRNLGRPGICSMALSAVDSSLWDLKARLLNVPLAIFLGMAHERVPIYGSGGFTSYSNDQLQKQLGDWVAQGISMVKMKIGRCPNDDLSRVQAAREAIGPQTRLFVDANGGYSRKQALAFAEKFADLGVSWFEEPVPSDDLEGLHLLRDRAPAEMDIAAGEYGYDLPYFLKMLDADAVDVLQADASRCGGISGFLNVAALCQARLLPLSSHCAPSLHLPAACAVPPFLHMEYFYDHVRIEQMLFGGVPQPVGGMLAPDLSRPGLGLDLKRADAEPYAV